MNVPIGSEYDPSAPWNEKPHKMRTCWNCEGTRKEVNLVPAKGLVGVFKEEETDCSLCEGSGEIPADDSYFQD